MRLRICIPLLFLFTGLSSAFTCPSYFEGSGCLQIKCINGGYPDGDKTVCNCPPGYLGIHCEAVRTSPAPDGHFKTSSMDTINIINVNLLTHYWGQNTYQNIQKVMRTRFPDVSLNYMETNGNAYYSPDGSSVISNISFEFATPVPKSIPMGQDTPVYSCFEIKLYEGITKFIKEKRLSNTVLNIFTQHPPTDDGYEDALSMTAAFNVKVNVLWTYDYAFSRCHLETDSDSSKNKFKRFVENSGGMFSSIQGEIDDSTTKNFITTVLNTHYRMQVLGEQSWSDCSGDGKQLDFLLDDSLQGATYYFAVIGENATTTQVSIAGCHLQTGEQISSSYDGQVRIFQSNTPSCSSFIAKSSKGGCTAKVYTIGGDQKGVDVFVSYVEDQTIDASRYALLQGTKLYPVVHVESYDGSLVKVTSADLLSDTAGTKIVFKNRSSATFDYVSSVPITCTTNIPTYLRLNIVSASSSTTRSIRVLCQDKPISTTPSPVTTTALPVTSEGTTEVVSTTPLVPCEPVPVKRTFLLAYATDLFTQTYTMGKNAVELFVTTRLANTDFDVYANARFDAQPQFRNFNTTEDVTDFNVNLDSKYPANSTFKLSDDKSSDVMQVLKIAAESISAIESSVIVLFLNRMPPKSNALSDLEPMTYTTLVNKNVKVFPIISQSSFLQAASFKGVRSGDVFNKIAALTNGHYIVANDTLNSDTTSDYVQIVNQLLYLSLGQELLFTRSVSRKRQGLSDLGMVRVPNTADVSNVNLTVSVSMSVFDSDNTLPSLPDTLLLKIGSATVDLTQHYDFKSSNILFANVSVSSGDAAVRLMYTPANVEHDILIRIWAPRTQKHSASYVALDGKESAPDTVNGAALRLKASNACNNKASISILSCDGTSSTKYDNIQNDVLFQDNWFNSAPYFCDVSSPNTCVDGTSNKYDVQFSTDGFTVSRSFLCQTSDVEPSPQCSNVDGSGNIRCTGNNAPFKRGPSGKLTDCSDHGSLFYNSDVATTSYADHFQCRCDDLFTGESCEQGSCASPDTTVLVTDNSYHTYTIVIGVDGVDSDPLTIWEGVKQLFNPAGNTYNPTSVWKYQLIIYCADRNVEVMYSGSSIADFKSAINRLPSISCSSVGQFDLTDIYKTTVRGIGNNIKGIVAFYTESPNKLNVSLPQFIASSQVYQQQLFVFTAQYQNSPTTGAGDVPADVSRAAMSTGGFMFWTTSEDPAGPKANPEMLWDMLTKGSSIGYIREGITDNSFTFNLEPNAAAYVVFYNRAAMTIDKSTEQCLGTETFGTMSICHVPVSADAKAKLLTIASQQAFAKPYSAAVYVLGDVNPSARIISNTLLDTADAVSTTSTSTRTNLAIHVPSGWQIIPNQGDNGVTRYAKRSACAFEYTASTVFVNTRYTDVGPHFAQVTLRNADKSITVTRFFAYGTTIDTVCQNGGTAVKNTGACACPTGYGGADCSQIVCSMGTQNAWANACNCDNSYGLQCDQVAATSEFDEVDEVEYRPWEFFAV